MLAIGRSESFESRVVIVSVLILTLVSLFTLQSVATNAFFGYLVLVAFAFLAFYIFLKFGFEIFFVFSKHIYFLCLFLLLANLILGQVTRGAVRWLPLGALSFQPSEVVRPFLLLYFARILGDKSITTKSIMTSLVFFAIPFVFILVQPSFGVAVLTAVGYLGVLLSSNVNKKRLFAIFCVVLVALPIGYGLLRPFQKERLASFLNPWENPQGAGYNSIQSMISVGSGGLFGRGLGEGVGTQLKFLPEKHNDFIFAAISEEMGFLGASIVLFAFLALFWAIADIFAKQTDTVARGFVGGVFLSLLAQVFINIGMNTGIVPITGVPLPFVSMGGSSLLASLISIALILRTQKKVLF